MSKHRNNKDWIFMMSHLNVVALFCNTFEGHLQVRSEFRAMFSCFVLTFEI
jgi:hypothetical protein